MCMSKPLTCTCCHSTDYPQNKHFHQWDQSLKTKFSIISIMINSDWRGKHTVLIRITKGVKVVWMKIVIGVIEGICAHGGKRVLILVFQEVQLADQLCRRNRVQHKKSHTQTTMLKKNDNYRVKKMKWIQTNIHRQTQTDRYLHFGVNHEREECFCAPQLHFNACTAVAFWENLCGMEGYCGRQWRRCKVAMEIRARRAENCPTYLHHPRRSPIACCQGAGQLEKSANVCEVDAKKCCWALCVNLSKENKCCVCVCESLGLYVGWLCEVVGADKRCSTFPLTDNIHDPF